MVAPTRPADTPGYTELDPATGLHMTGTPVNIDVASYRLEVTGKVKNELKLSLDDLRCMPKITTKSTSVCSGFFEDRATWAGVPFSHILELAGVMPEATMIDLHGADGYSSLSMLEPALLPDAYLAYEWKASQSRSCTASHCVQFLIPRSALQGPNGSWELTYLNPADGLLSSIIYPGRNRLPIMPFFKPHIWST